MKVRKLGKRLALTSAVAGMMAAPLGLMAPAQAAPSGDVTINLLNINDFHGRIDDGTVGFAATIQKLRLNDGANGGNTLLLSAGDNFGASLFASAVQEDKPTIDVLNALGLKASAVGNHEFDKGFADLTSRVDKLADFPYLGANVYTRAAGSDDPKPTGPECFNTKPALQQYATFDVNGLTVGVIGAVTQSTPDKVSPGGIKQIQFCDPVMAVNRVVKQLTDGNTGNGEADVLVAEYHSGAPDSYTGDLSKGQWLQKEFGESPAFAKIVKHTSPKVDALMTGDSHQAYALQAPVWKNGTKTSQTRPLLETGSYHENVGHVTLQVDPATGDVSNSTVENVPSLESDKIGALANDPKVQKVQQIVKQALAYAEKIGNKPVGKITDDITTAFTDTNGDGKYTPSDARDDRSQESTLGDLVANMLLYTFRPDADVSHHADLGIINPGGLRAELFYQGDTADNKANTDGVVTYAEANEVLPFGDNLWTVDLTGSQLKTILEQQWQPADADDPYLQLGLSSNVTYTFDPDAAKGHHISQVMIDVPGDGVEGFEPLDPDKTYTVATESFLGEGGDHFYEFANGTHHDSGMIDREGWLDFWHAHNTEDTAVSPDFARQSTVVQGLSSTTVRAGDTLSFTLSKLDLHSVGSPKNTEVTVSLHSPSPVDLGTFPVTDGSAKIDVTIPASMAAGQHTLVVVAQPTNTTVRVPITVTAAATTPPPTTAPPTTAPPTSQPPTTTPPSQLPTKVPAGMSGSGSSSNGPGAGVAGGVAGGVLAVLLLGVAAFRRKGSHQA